MSWSTGVEVIRGGHVECRHAVDVAVCDRHGRLVAWFGEPARPTFLRSSAKPLQALAAWRCGIGERFGIAPGSRELAIMSASHGATDAQREAVFRVLAAGGLPESALQCGVHEPYSAEGRAWLRKLGRPPSPVCGNCSGKHAGQLLACLAVGWPLGTYRRLDHPLTGHVRAVIAEVGACAVDEVPLAVDGCGLPTPVMPLRAAATAFARLLDPAQAPVGRALLAHPELIGSPDSFNVALTTRMAGIAAKSGAEACFCATVVEPRLGLAVKVHDGGQRGVAPAVMAALRQLGVGTPTEHQALAEFARPGLVNLHGEPVGDIVAGLELER